MILWTLYERWKAPRRRQADPYAYLVRVWTVTGDVFDVPVRAPSLNMARAWAKSLFRAEAIKRTEVRKA